MIFLCVTRHPDRRAIERGVQMLIDHQLPNGDWPQVVPLYLINYMSHPQIELSLRPAYYN